MPEPTTRVGRVCALLNATEARYVLVGASAMQLWGTTRATRDVDILIEPTLENAQRVLTALSQLPWGVAAEWDASAIIRKPVTIIGDQPNVDILTVAWSVHYRDAAPAATVFEVEGVRIPTASIPHLIASKRTGRLQDAADILVLEEILKSREGRPS